MYVWEHRTSLTTVMCHRATAQCHKKGQYCSTLQGANAQIDTAAKCDYLFGAGGEKRVGDLPCGHG